LFDVTPSMIRDRKGVPTMRSSIRRSLGVVAGASALLLVSGAFYSEAQEPARTRAGSAKVSKKVAAPVVDDEDEAPAPKPATRRKSDPRRRLYPYFGQLGLTDAQKQSIYDIRAKHATRINALEKQLEDARGQAIAEAEGVLTPAQKKLLEDRRKAARSAAESRSAGEPKAKAAEPEAEPAPATPAKKKRRRARDE
jgi:hypothetical protein